MKKLSGNWKQAYRYYREDSGLLCCPCRACRECI